MNPNTIATLNDRMADGSWTRCGATSTPAANPTAATQSQNSLRPKKQNHRPNQDAQNWNGEVHGKGVVVVVIDSVIPSEVEESLSILEISRDVSTLLDMTGRQNKSASPFWKGRGLR